MDIFRAEKIAQDRHANSRDGEWDRDFVLMGATGMLECKWLDPYFGMFQVKGKDGFLRSSDVPAGVEALMAEENVTDL